MLVGGNSPVYAQLCHVVSTGAMYGLESFTQLLSLQHGGLELTAVNIVDSPDYVWRGLMLDRWVDVPFE